MEINARQLANAVKALPASNIQVKNYGQTQAVTVKLSGQQNASKFNAKA